MNAEIVALSACDLARNIHRRSLSCQEVMQAYLTQIERLNPAVNAIVSPQNTETLLQEAKERDLQLAKGIYLGWMHGFPQAPKDLCNVAGLVTTNGSPIFKHNVAQADSIIVERARRAGAIFIGKTNSPECGLGSHTYNTVFGTTGNAFNPQKTAGGSSGGAAVALALRMLPVADGSDMMGSLRNPAGYNNIVSLRPSFGRVPLGPSNEVFYQQLAVEGPMARSVTDLALFLAVQSGFDARTPLAIDQAPVQFTLPLQKDHKGVRIGWLGDFNGYLATEPGVLDVTQNALRHFTDMGCTVEAVQPAFDMARLWNTWLTLRGFLVVGTWGDLYANETLRAQMKPELQWEIATGLKLSAQAVYKASVDRSAWYTALDNLFQDFDFLVLPSAQVFPFDAHINWPKEIAGKTMDTYHRWMEVVIGATLAGVPVVTVPAGFNAAGMPIGLQIMARSRADFAALQIAYAYEQASGYTKIESPLLSSVS